MLDLDLRQQSMGHFFAHRAAWLAANGVTAPMPVEHPLSADLAKASDEEALARFEEAFNAAEASDYILIDTLPYLGVLVQNALAAADEVLVPLQAQWLASDSVRMMVMEVRNFVKSEVNPDLRLAGFLFTQVEPQATVQRDQMAYVRRQYGEDAHIFETMIEARLSVQESQSPAVRQSMFRYKPTDPVTYAYRALAQELLNGEA